MSLPVPPKVVLLLSGGIDSVTLLYEILHTGVVPYCLLIEYGQRHSQELQMAKWHCHQRKVNWATCTIPTLAKSLLTDGSGSWVVPNRNAIFLSMAVNTAVSIGAEEVLIGCNGDDRRMFPDCTEEFINAYDFAVKQAGLEVQITAPYLNMTKAEIVAQAKKLGVPLEQTWSCYRGGQTECGVCPACITKNFALTQS